MEPDQSRPRLCHPSLRIINIRLLQCISCMCLPCGSSLKLTHAASKHSPRVALKCHPDGSPLMGEGLGRRGPGTVCAGRRHLLPVAEESPFLSCFACLVGVGELENIFLSFSFKKTHFNPSHSWKNHNPPAVSKSFGLEKHVSSLLSFASVDRV